MSATDPPINDASASDSLLLAQLRAGERDAAGVLFERYLSRLTALARSRLSTKLAARVDADDVVMSAYRSFFVRVQSGAFEIPPGGDLWRLLVEITLHKLYRQAAHHAAQRRSVARETAATSAPALASAREPSSEAAAALADELSAVLKSLAPETRQALELRLQGCELAEIATTLGKTERTVRRWLDDVKSELRRRFPESVPLPEDHAPRKLRPQRKPLSLDLLGVGPLLPFNDYTLQRQVGSGGTGKVYRAVVQPGNVIVAVKFMQRKRLSSVDIVERFVNEARIVARLSHPGIIRIHGLGRTPNRGYFLAMDFFARGDLQARLKNGPFAVHEAVDWVRQAAEAIAHAHEHGVIHCDLKPSNLLLADDGRIIVSDFGLARSLADHGEDHRGGTPAFLAPEQLDSRWGSVGPATDVYGFGAVLLTLLSGSPPRTGTVREILAAVARGDEVRLPAELPGAIRDLCRRCLSASPVGRPASAAEVAEELRP